jgi:hypothetical protein
MIIRDAELRDARGIAEVHVRSWQAAYVGIVPDEDLARLSVDQREQFWTQILSKDERATFVLVNGDLVVDGRVLGPREMKTAIKPWLPSCTAYIYFRSTGAWVMASSFTEPQKPGFAKAWSRTWFCGCSTRILVPAVFTKRWIPIREWKAERNALCRSYYRNGGTLSEVAERGDRFGDQVIIPIDAGGFRRAVVAFPSRAADLFPLFCSWFSFH